MTNITDLYQAPKLSLDVVSSDVQASLAFFATCKEIQDNNKLPEEVRNSVAALFVHAETFLDALEKSGIASSYMGSLAATEKTYIETLMSDRITGPALMRGFQRLQKRANDCQKNCNELKEQFMEIGKTLREAQPAIVEYQKDKSSRATTKTVIAGILIVAAVAAGIATGGAAIIAASIAEEVLVLGAIASGTGVGGGVMRHFAGKDHDAANAVQKVCNGVDSIVKVLDQFISFWDIWKNKMSYLEDSCRREDDDDTYAIDPLEGRDLIRQWYGAEQAFNQYTKQSREWFSQIGRASSSGQ